MVLFQIESILAQEAMPVAGGFSKMIMSVSNLSRNRRSSEHTMGTLQEEFEFVRKTFFPRWDHKKEWRVESVADLHGAVGEYRKDLKTVFILGQPTGEALQLVMIHELCHARCFSHKTAWQFRMMKAADRAPA